MRINGSMVRVYGCSILAVVLSTVVATAVIIGGFSDVPEIRYLVPIVALWTGVLVVSWLALALGYVIRTRFSRTVGPVG